MHKMGKIQQVNCRMLLWNQTASPNSIPNLKPNPIRVYIPVYPVHTAFHILHLNRARRAPDRKVGDRFFLAYYKRPQN